MLKGIFFRDIKNEKMNMSDDVPGDLYFANENIPEVDGFNFRNQLTLQDFKFNQTFKYKQHMSKEEYKNDYMGRDSVNVSLSCLLLDKSDRLVTDNGKDFRTFIDVVSMINKGMFEEIGLFFSNDEYNPDLCDITDYFREYMKQMKKGKYVSQAGTEDPHFGRITDVSCGMSVDRSYATLSITASFIYEIGGKNDKK